MNIGKKTERDRLVALAGHWSWNRPDGTPLPSDMKRKLAEVGVELDDTVVTSGTLNDFLYGSGLWHPY